MLDTKSLSQALAAIRSRLTAIDEQIAALKAERERLHKGEEGLSALLGETKPPPEPETSRRGPGRPQKSHEPVAPPKLHVNTFQSRFLTAVRQAPRTPDPRHVPRPVAKHAGRDAERSPAAWLDLNPGRSSRSNERSL